MEVKCDNRFSFRNWRPGVSKIIFGEVYLCRAAKKKLELGEFKVYGGDWERIANWLEDNIELGGNEKIEPCTDILSLVIWKELEVKITPSQVSYLLREMGYRQTITAAGLSTEVYGKLNPSILQRYWDNEFNGGFRMVPK